MLSLAGYRVSMSVLDMYCEDLFPDKYKYRISKCNVEVQSEKNIVFNTKMRVNVRTEPDTKVFFSDQSSGCTITYNTQSVKHARQQDGEEKIQIVVIRKTGNLEKYRLQGLFEFQARESDSKI